MKQPALGSLFHRGAIALLAAALMAPSTAHAAGEIPAGKTLVVVGQDPASVDDYESTLGTPAAGEMTYLFLEDAPAKLGAGLAAAEARADRRGPGAVVQVGLGVGSTVWNTLAGAPTGPGMLGVGAGLRDRQIAALAKALNASDHTWYLRIGYEFDLLGGQWGTPEEYKLGYRRVVDRLRAAGVDNAAYVWHSAGAFWRLADYSGKDGFIGGLDQSRSLADPFLGATSTDLLPIARFYPGRRYVDFFAVSYFGDACCFGRSSKASRDVYDKRTRELLSEAQALGLPSMIGEATPAYAGFDSGADSLDWLDRFLGLVEAFDLRMTSLIVPDWPKAPGQDWDAAFWNGYWPDARVHRHRSAREEWVRRTSAPRYVHG